MNLIFFSYNFGVQVNSVSKEIDLADEKNTISKNLSGGQKRKLCVGIALIGDPKVSEYWGAKKRTENTLLKLINNGR